MSKKFISVLLCLCIVLSSWVMAGAADNEITGQVTVLCGGSAAGNVTVPEGGSVQLSAVSAVEGELNWQIELGGTWANIGGEPCQTLDLTYAMVYNALSSSGKCSVRAAVTDGEEVYPSAPVFVKVGKAKPAEDTSTGDDHADKESVGQDAAVSSIVGSETMPAPERKSVRFSAPALKSLESSFTALAAPEPEGEKRTITINFVYENGSIASDPHIEQYPKDYDFTEAPFSYPVPVISNYQAYVDGQICDKISFTGQLTDNVEVTVVYKPMEVSYSITYSFQNANDDAYTTDPSKTLSKTGMLGSKVGSGYDTHFEGFLCEGYDTDASISEGAIIDIKYKRLYYLVDLDLDGGFGADPVYDRFGKAISINAPQKNGYVFTGWSPAMPGAIPAANTSYKANWAVADTSYTVNYWRQNADDDNYTYYCSETKVAVTGSTVSGTGKTFNSKDASDYRETNLYFTYGHADQDVVVASDGSTIVNVYYDRELYTIDFYIGDPGEIIHHEAQTIHHDAEYKTVHHDAVYFHHEAIGTPGSTGTIGGLASAGSSLGNNKADVNKGVTKNSSGVCWIPIYTDYNKDLTWSICPASYDVYNNGWTEKTGYEQGKSGQTHYQLALYDGSSVTVVDLENTYCTKNGYELLKIKYSFDGTDYVGYVRKEYVTNIKPNEGYTPAWDELVREAWDEEVLVKEAWDEVIPAYDEGTGKYYPRSSTSLKPITHGTAIPSVTVGGEVYKDKYTIHVRYGQDVKDIWPMRTMIEPVVDGLNFKCLYSPHNGIGETITDQYVINEQLLNKSHLGDPAVSTAYYVTYSDAAYKITLRYRDLSSKEEDPNGELLDIQTCYFGGFNTELNPRDFPGYVYIGKGNYYTDRFGHYYSQADYYAYASGGGENYTFFYTRQEFDVTYHNAGDPVYTIRAKYKDPLSGTDALTEKAYNHVPDYPETLEPNAYEFVGWYADPLFQTPFDFANTTMPNAGIEVYAKYDPKVHEVKVLNDAIGTGTEIKDQPDIPHGTYAEAPAVPVDPAGRVFAGWFYMDGEQEKPFSFEHTPIKKDMTVYAKWSMDYAVNYVIHYYLEGTTDKVAEDTTGNAPAGSTRAFMAKGGSELYPAYQESYFPTEKAINLNMTSALNEYIFYYKNVPAVPYIVECVDTEGTSLLNPQVYEDNKKAVVTEFAPFIPGYKLTEDSEDVVIAPVIPFEGDDNPNVIRFVYEANTAPYRVEHYTRQPDGTYILYKTEPVEGEELKAVVGSTVTASPLTIEGYAVNPNAEGYKPSGIILAEGDEGYPLVLKLYYDPSNASLTISKSAELYDANDRFIFHVYRGQILVTDVVVAAGEEVTISNLPVDTYTVVEDEAWSWRYTPDTVCQDITLNGNPAHDRLSFANSVDNIYYFSGSANAVNTKDGSIAD